MDRLDPTVRAVLTYGNIHVARVTATELLPHQKGGEQVDAHRKIIGQASRSTYPNHLLRQQGQGLAEYALILALIAIMAIIALLFLGSQISSKLSVIGDAV